MAKLDGASSTFDSPTQDRHAPALGSAPRAAPGHAQAGHGRVTASSAPRGGSGKRVRKLPAFTGNDALYQAVYSQMGKLESHQSE